MGANKVRIYDFHVYSVRERSPRSYAGIRTPCLQRAAERKLNDRAAAPAAALPERKGEMMKLKWTMNGVTFNRSNYRPVIARFDNTTCWLSLAACTTTSGFRAAVRELAAAYGAKTVELKYFYDDDDNQTETNVVDFMKLYSEELDKSYFIFRNELKVPSGTPRKFINYTEGEIFTTA